MKWLQRRNDETLRAYDARVGQPMQLAAALAVLLAVLALYSVAGPK